MENRELLEMAAKAVGQERSAAGDLWSNARGLPWDPLKDDGDALRLAVKLRMRIHHDGACANVEMPTGQKYCWVGYATVEGNDHFAAMRCAIVRTAAEIGKAMP